MALIELLRERPLAHLVPGGLHRVAKDVDTPAWSWTEQGPVRQACGRFVYGIPQQREPTEGELAEFFKTIAGQRAGGALPAVLREARDLVDAHRLLSTRVFCHPDDRSAVRTAVSFSARPLSVQAAAALPRGTAIIATGPEYLGEVSRSSRGVSVIVQQPRAFAIMSFGLIDGLWNEIADVGGWA